MEKNSVKEFADMCKKVLKGAQRCSEASLVGEEVELMLLMMILESWRDRCKSFMQSPSPKDFDARLLHGSFRQMELSMMFLL